MKIVKWNKKEISNEATVATNDTIKNHIMNPSYLFKILVQGYSWMVNTMVYFVFH